MRSALVVVCVMVAARYGWPFGVGLLVVGWLAHAWMYPWRSCWWPFCRGRPVNSDGRGNFNIFCPVCGGRGRLRRLSSRLLRRGFGDL